MKKLLSLLSVLTISGTAIPTTIAASTYQEENNNNNLKKTRNFDSNNKKQENNQNNFEKSNQNKNKRQVNQQKSKKILKLTEKLIIDINNRRQYINSFNTFRNSLVTNNILRPYFDLNSILIPEINNLTQENYLYTLNTENYGYFRLPVEIRGNDPENQESFFRNLELVFRTDNLYLQGFIVNNNYYHFNFNNVNINMQPQSVRDGSVPLLTQIEGMENIQLENISPDYPNNMIPSNSNEITWQSIFDSFWRLTGNNIDIHENPLGELAIALGQVIFVTAESLRFWAIYAEIADNIIIANNSIELNTNSNNNYYGLLISWRDESNIIALAIQHINNLSNNNNQINLQRYLRGTVRQYVRNIVNNIANQPLNATTYTLVNSNIRILLGTFILRDLNCDRQKRVVTNNYWKEKICNLENEIKKIKEEITTFKILDENNKGNNLKAEDIYIGTKNGIYLLYEKNNEINLKKFNNLDFKIEDIILDDNGNAYIINSNNEIYYLNSNNWNSEKVKINNVTDEELKIIVKAIKDEENNQIITNIKNVNMYIKNSFDFYLSFKDKYIATKNKVYFMKNDIIIGKFLTEQIKDIHLNYNGDAYGITYNNDIYDLTINLDNWNAKNYWKSVNGEGLESWYQINLNTLYKMHLSYRCCLYIQELYNIYQTRDEFKEKFYKKICQFLPNSGNVDTGNNYSITAYIAYYIFDNWNDFKNKTNKMNNNSYMWIETYKNGGGNIHYEL